MRTVQKTYTYEFVHNNRVLDEGWTRADDFEDAVMIAAERFDDDGEASIARGNDHTIRVSCDGETKTFVVVGEYVPQYYAQEVSNDQAPAPILACVLPDPSTEDAPEDSD